MRKVLNWCPIPVFQGFLNDTGESTLTTKNVCVCVCLYTRLKTLAVTVEKPVLLKGCVCAYVYVYVYVYV